MPLLDRKNFGGQLLEYNLTWQVPGKLAPVRSDCNSSKLVHAQTEHGLQVMPGIRLKGEHGFSLFYSS